MSYNKIILCLTIHQIEHELSTLIRKAKLKFPDVAKEDLISVLNNFKDLQPDVVNFVFPDGISRNCLSLAGTIPIHYKVTFPQ